MIVVPVLMLLALLVVGMGRTVSAQQDVVGAARAAARAASLASGPGDAAAAAQRAAAAAVGGRCPQVTVTPQVGAFVPGGSVTVTIACTVSLSQVAISGLPGHVTLTATASAPIETYRQVTR